MISRDHRLWAGAALIVAGAIASMQGASIGAYVLMATIGVLVLITHYSTKE